MLCNHCKIREVYNENLNICKVCYKTPSILKYNSLLNKYKKFLKKPIFWNFYGHMISDGGVYSYPNRNFIIYSNKEDKLLTEVRNEIKELFRMKRRTKKNRSGLVLSSKVVSIFLQQIEQQKLLPNDADSISLFLRACFDDEGSISKQGIISIVQNSEEYINNISLFLLKFGISSTPYLIFNRKYLKNYFCLRISKKFNKTFFDNIGFTHPRKYDILSRNLTFNGR